MAVLRFDSESDNPVDTLKANLGSAGSGNAFYTNRSDPNDPQVFLGNFKNISTRPGGNKPLPGGGRLPATQETEGPITLPLSEAIQYVYGLDPDELNKMTERAWYLGYSEVSAPNDVMGFVSLWKTAVQNAALFQANGKNLTPMQVLEYGATGNTKTRADRALAGGVRTQKSRAIELTDPVSAKALIRQTFQTALGRDPTDAEIQTLADSLKAAEQKNPRVSVTSATFDENGVQTDTTTTTSGGLNPSDFLTEQVQDDPEAREYQAAAQYFPALMQMLGSAYGL